MTKIESEIATISDNVNKQYEELKRLISQKQRTTQETFHPPKGTNKIPSMNPRQTERTATPQTNKPASPTNTYRPINNVYSPMHQKPSTYPISCWNCGISGHISRNCPMKSQSTTYSTRFRKSRFKASGTSECVHSIETIWKGRILSC